MSSKSTQQTKKTKKKTSSETQTRKNRPLSPGAATFEALNNPAYDTSVKHFSPPMSIPQSPPRLQNLGITGPSPPRRTRSLDDIPRSSSMDEDDPVDRSMTRSPNVFEPPFPMKDEDEEELDLVLPAFPHPMFRCVTIVAVEHADADADADEPSSVPRRGVEEKGARSRAEKREEKEANPLSNSLLISIRHSFLEFPKRG